MIESQFQQIEGDQTIIDVGEEQQNVQANGYNNRIDGLLESYSYDPASIKGRIQSLVPHLEGVQISDMYSRDGIDFKQNIEDTVQFLRDEFQFNDEELAFVFQKNYSAFFQLKKDGSHPGIYLIKKYFVDQKEFPVEKVKSLILRGPRIFALSQDILNGQFDFLNKKCGLSDVPELLYKSGEWHYSQIFEYFQIYMKWESEKIVELLNKNPWILALNLRSFMLHLKQLKSYKFDKNDIYELLSKDASILAQKPNTIRQLFTTVREKLRVKSNIVSSFKSYIQQLLKNYAMRYPDILLQGKFKALEKKIEHLQNNGCSQFLIRKVFEAHPELFLKSLKSFEVKIEYFSKNVGINLKEEEYFPLCLMFDFRQVIYPRLQILMKQRNINSSNIDLSQILAPTDEQFCEKFEIPLLQLQAYRSQEYKEEKDILWRYVTKI